MSDEITIEDIAPAQRDAFKKAMQDVNLPGDLDEIKTDLDDLRNEMDDLDGRLTVESASTSVTNATVSLPLDVSAAGKPRGIVEVRVQSSTNATYKIQGSIDNSSFFDKASISHTAGNTEETINNYINAFPYLRVKSDDNIASHEIDIVTSQR